MSQVTYYVCDALLERQVDVTYSLFQCLAVKTSKFRITFFLHYYYLDSIHVHNCIPLDWESR